MVRWHLDPEQVALAAPAQEARRGTTLARSPALATAVSFEPRAAQFAPGQWKDQKVATITMACLRKRRYAAVNEAQRQAQLASRRVGAAVRVYRCPICFGWHLTSAPRRRNGRY